MIRYPCECSEVDVPHNYLKEREDGGRTVYLVECAECGSQHEMDKHVWDLVAADELRVAQKRRANLTRFPYVDPFSGVEVKSKEHREDVWRAHGFHKAEHGINESFDDEACDNLRRKRQALEARRLATKRKREDYIRQGILKPKRPEPKRA